MNKNVLWATALGVVIGGLGIASIKTLPNAVAQDTGHKAPGLSASRTISSISTEDMASLRNLDQSFSALAEYVSPSVVHIRSTSISGSDIFGRRMGESGGVGTGVIFRSDGWIITNDHVVGGFDKVTVVLPDGREFVGQVRRASESDIAVVKIDATGLNAANFADSSAVKPGQFTIAVGSPFDLDNTVTFGHVSALGRVRMIPDARLDTADKIRLYPDLIQTDAPINQGNSGGPLFNIDGQVIGINSAIASTTGGSNGIGFAIPSNLARMLAETLIEKGKVSRGALGLVPEDIKPYRKKELNISGGALVASVSNDSPAAKAGLKKDDILTRIGSTEIKSQMDVRMAMYKHAPGSRVDVEVLRDGKKMNFNVASVSPESLVSGTKAPERSNGGQVPKRELNPFQNDIQIPEMDEFFKNMPQPGQDNDVRPLRSGPAKLGVSISGPADDAQNRTKFKIPAGVSGAIILDVESGSVASKIGLEPGCVVTKIGDKVIKNGDELKKAISTMKWNDKSRIEFSKYGDGMQMSQSRDFTFR